MNLPNINLETWLETAPDSAYSNNVKITYFDFYKVFKEQAIAIHDQVTAAANYSEAIEGNLIFMNDHGPKHIETVINRATKLLEDAPVILTAQEVYFLLTAIHIHDIGNLYGRINHVNDMRYILQKLSPYIKLDAVNIKYIRSIAEAHGGRLPNGDKDKIEVLNDKESTLEGEVRVQLLASILRLADELADDKYRSSNILLQENRLGESEIYHAYSYCLSNVIVNHSIKQIELQFHIPEKFATKYLKKDGRNRYLVDEIYERVLKMHHERHYTMRFTRGQIDLTSILVRIEFYAEDYTQEQNYQLPDKITFVLKEKGYPDTAKKNIFDICDNLKFEGKNMNGTFFKKQISDFKKSMT